MKKPPWWAALVTMFKPPMFKPPRLKPGGDAAGSGFTGSCARPRGRPTHDGRWSARS